MSTKPSPGAGKPRQPTAKEMNEIITLARIPSPLPLICRALKLNQATVERWLEDGRAARQTSDLRTFADDYDAATALADINARKILADHAKTSPEAAFRLMELKAKEAEAPPESSKPLRNQTHEAFCQFIALHGMKAGPAWQKITGIPNRSAEVVASRVLSKVEVQARITALQIAKHQSNVLTREDRLRVCHEVVNSATANHRDRMTAAKLDAELKGELIGRQDLTTNGETLPAAMPPIVFNMPATFTRQRGQKE